jgi:imidazolonepropionase-like amidohydrolase
MPNAYVVIRDDRILNVGSGDPQIPPEATVVDAEGGTILPGLVDAHAHSTNELIIPGDLRVELDGFVPWLREGVTTLRDVGTVPLLFPAILDLAAEQEHNHKAPRIVWAGPIITAVGGYPTTVLDYAAVAQEVASAEEAVQLVDKLADGGARIIKLGLERGYRSDEGWPLLSLDEVSMITQGAHQRGLLVTAHVTSLDEVRLALDGGVDDLAHTPIEPLPDEMIQEMLRRGITMASTANIWGPESRVAAANAKRYLDAGGTVALATDFGCCDQAPGMETMLQEMQWLSQVGGFTAMELIVATTRNGAIVSNLGNDLGTIEPGKVADIIIVEGDPLLNLQALANISIVIQAGTVVVGSR